MAKQLLHSVRCVIDQSFSPYDDPQTHKEIELTQKKLKIWIVAIIEPLLIEKGERVRRYGNLAYHLAHQGHDVTYWTSNFSHNTKSHIVQEDQDVNISPGLKVKILAGPGYAKNVSFERIRHHKDFARKFLNAAQSYEKPDVILTPIPVLEVAEAVAQFSLKNKIPYLIDIRDCWPEEFVRLLPKPIQFLGSILFYPLFKKARFACQNATALLGVSTEFLNYGLNLGRRTRSQLDRVMPIGYRKEELTQEQIQAGKSWLETLSISDADFVICFFGTIGRFFALETVIAAAKELTNDNVKFVIAGTGDSIEKYKEMASGLNNVLFPGWIKNIQIQAILERSQAGLAPYREDALMTMPNKPFEYMAAGIPILASLKGELAEIIEHEKIGFIYPAYDVQELKNCILKLKHSPSLAKQMGQKAKIIFQQDFSTEVIQPKFEQLLLDVSLSHKLN